MLFRSPVVFVSFRFHFALEESPFVKKNSSRKDSPKGKSKTPSSAKYRFPLWFLGAVVVFVGVVAYWNSFDAPLDRKTSRRERV